MLHCRGRFFFIITMTIFTYSRIKLYFTASYNTKPDIKISCAIQQVTSLFFSLRREHWKGHYNKWVHKLLPIPDSVCSNKTDKHSSNVLQHVYSQFSCGSHQMLIHTISKVIRKLNGSPLHYKNFTVYKMKTRKNNHLPKM